MNKIIKNLTLIATLIACGFGKLIEARGGGGFRGGGGGRGGGSRGGAMRSHSGGGGARRGSMHPGKGGRHGYGGGGRGNYHGGRNWNHRYGYNFNLFPWGAFLLTAPWWTSWNWGSYYANNPGMQDEIDSLRSDLASNVAEIRRKDKRLADLEDRLTDIEEDSGQQSALNAKISLLKSELRSLGKQTKKLESKLKSTAGISDADINA